MEIKFESLKVIRVRPEWLALRTEAALEPELEIIDPHHHLWVRPSDNYLLDEFSEEVAAGHNIKATVFIECYSHYREDGAPEMRVVGETEFVVRETSRRPRNGHAGTRFCAGIVS